MTPEGLPISREDTVSPAQDKAQEILKTYRNDDINVAMKDTQSNLQITNKTSSVGFRQGSSKYARFFGHQSFHVQKSPFKKNNFEKESHFYYICIHYLFALNSYKYNSRQTALNSM